MPAQLDALALHEAVRQRLVDFAADHHFTRDPQLNEICRRIWAGPPESGGLVSNLWVEGAFPPEQSNEALQDLVQQGRFSAGLARHLHKRGAFDQQRLLYTHQRQAILAAGQTRSNGERPAILVTAGTGGGKTESFLLPILNELFENPRTAGGGVRCLILYPMNALVNDQVDRLYDWLQDQPDEPKVTLFNFTSETPEDHSQANRDGVPRWEKCRLRTRRAARGLETCEGQAIDLRTQPRGRTPDILVSNYSMLEYMLCRPQDAVFFGAALRAVVLDEAHLYTGTLAAEITLLFRRLLERCGLRPEQVFHFATSATMGSGDRDELRQFAAKLFTKREDLVEIIIGETQRVKLPDSRPPQRQPKAPEVAGKGWLDCSTLELGDDGKARLAINPNACNTLAADLPLLAAEDVVHEAKSGCEGKPAILLCQALQHAPLIHRLEAVLWQRRCLWLEDLAAELWAGEPDALDATRKLLQMAASARQGPRDYPLVPHRLHFLARPTDGLIVCLDANCTGDLTRKVAPLGCVSAGLHDRCPFCEGAVLSLYRCAHCGEWLLAGVPGKRAANLCPVADPWNGPAPQFFALGLRPGGGGERVIEPRTGRVTGHGGAGVEVTCVVGCPQCGGDGEVAAGDLKPFMASSPLTLSILAESVFAELPEFPDPNNLWLPARGRRMLAFSDSRQEAARLGPRLRYQHEIQVVRAALARCLGANPVADEALIADLRHQVSELEAELHSASLTAAQRANRQNRLEATKRELREAESGGAIGNWADALANQPIIRELLDFDAGKRHEANSWSQARWDENFNAVKAQLRSILGRELASPVRPQMSLETVGLAEVCYPGLENLAPPDAFLGTLPSAGVRQRLRACWADFLAALCDTLRTDGCITLGNDEADVSYQFGRRLLGKWCAEQSSRAGYVLSFVGVTERNRRMRFAIGLLRRCGVPEADAVHFARQLLSRAFEQLREAAAQASLAWLEHQQVQTDAAPATAIRIRFPALTLRQPKLYRSTKTGSVWPRSVEDLAPEAGCDDLRPVTANELDRDPRYGRQRREFRSSPVFTIGLWAEEHSAQLSAKENRRLQDLFKVGIRNLLSSTTTLELGIDIGGLNCVLMSNVPPGKANYLQRAGRAGRRADGSSVVITYARPTPYDREVFQRFDEYLARNLRRPRVLLDRERIAQRHAQAFLLGEFFRAVYPPGAHVGAMRAFSCMGLFCGVELPDRWDGAVRPPLQRPTADWGAVANNPWWGADEDAPGLEAQFIRFLDWLADEARTSIRQSLVRLLAGTGGESSLRRWGGFVATAKDNFVKVFAAWRVDYQGLLNHWQSLDEPRPANAVRYDLRAMFDTPVIEALAERQVLPRYGFPIGLLRLKVEDEEFRLERAGLLALREYVPGSQLVVGGKLVTSRGLLKHWTGANPDNYFGLYGKLAICEAGHRFYSLGSDATACPICERPVQQAPQTLLLPRHGFRSAAWEKPKQSADIEKVGSIQRLTLTFAARSAGQAWSNFGRIERVRAQYQEDGELLIYNAGDGGQGFAICTKCGYADSETHVAAGAIQLPSGFKRHAAIHRENRYAQCWGENEASAVLRNRVLAARQTTDVLLVDFSAAFPPLASDDSLALTLGYALQISGASLLELDSRELGMMTVPVAAGGRSRGVVLYDNVPGGAGHVRELAELGRAWLESALQRLFISEAHHARCQTACLDCILTFDTQTGAAQNDLCRRRAHAVLNALLSGGELPPGTAVVPTQPDSPDGPAPHATSREERLARGRRSPRR